MTTPVVLKHRHNEVEALQFDGSHAGADALHRWIAFSVSEADYASMKASWSLNAPASFEFRLRGQRRTNFAEAGDWVVRDGDEFYVVPQESARFVTPIEKIKLEAGMN